MIANNAGVEGEVIVEALMGLPFEMGYNAMDDRCARQGPRAQCFAKCPKAPGRCSLPIWALWAPCAPPCETWQHSTVFDPQPKPSSTR